MAQLPSALSAHLKRLGPNSYKVATAFGMRGLSAALGFALSWTLARLYGPEGLGTYSVAVTTAVFGSYLALLGQDYIVLRSVAGELKVGKQGAARGVVRTSVLIATAAAVLAALAMAGFAELLSSRIGGRASSDMLILVAPAVLGLVLARIASWALRATGNVVLSQSLEGIITPALILAALGFWLMIGDLPPLWTIGSLYVGATFVGAAIGWLGWRRLTRAWPAAEHPAAGALLVAGLPMLISTVSNAAADWAALFSTNLFADAAAAGQLRVALQLMLAVTLLTSSFDAILGPQVAGAWRVGDHEALRRVFRKATIGMTVAAAPVLLAELLFPAWLMGLFGPGFREGATALQILALGQLFAIAGGPIGTVLIMSGHDRWLIGYSLLSVGVIAALCLLAVPAYGVTGGAMVIAGNMIFRRTAAQLILRYVVGLKLSVWRRARRD